MIEFPTISEVVRRGLCTGCGVCAACCPKHAIAMVIDDQKSTFQAQLKAELCSGCSICIATCAGLGINIPHFNNILFDDSAQDCRLGYYSGAFVGHCMDDSVRVGAASGGLVSGLLLFALEKGLIDGALVSRMKPDSPLETETFLATTRKDVLLSRKSLYCPVNLSHTLPELEKEGRYAVVGLPCHVHSIRKAQAVLPKLQKNVVLALGIFCSCGRSFHATRNLIVSHGIDVSQVKKLEYRSDEWSVDLITHMKDGTKKRIKGYYSSKDFAPFVNYRCTLCCDHTNELADISLGDAWHIGAKNSVGQSVVLTRTNEAADLLERAIKEGRFALRTASPDAIIRSQANMEFKKNQVGARFFWVSLLNKSRPSYGLRFPSSRGYCLQALWFYISNFLVFRQRGLKKAFAFLSNLYRGLKRF